MPRPIVDPPTLAAQASVPVGAALPLTAGHAQQALQSLAQDEAESSSEKGSIAFKAKSAIEYAVNPDCIALLEGRIDPATGWDMWKRVEKDIERAYTAGKKEVEGNKIVWSLQAPGPRPRAGPGPEAPGPRPESGALDPGPGPGAQGRGPKPGAGAWGPGPGPGAKTGDRGPETLGYLCFPRSASLHVIGRRCLSSTGSTRGSKACCLAR